MLSSYNRASGMADMTERRVLRITLKRSGIGCPRRSDADIEQDPRGDKLTSERFLLHVSIRLCMR